MPNWVCNRLTLKGESARIREVLEAIKPDDKGSEGVIDFNKIVPMPEELNIESGSTTDWGIEIYLSAVNPDNEYSIDGLKKMEKKAFEMLSMILNRERLFFKYRTTLSEDDVMKMTEHIGFEKLLENGKKAIDNLQKYGSITWYEWCIEHWGTKWNTSSSFYIDISDAEGAEGIEMQTAWSTPEPVIRELSKQYPDIEFTVEYADEDIGQNCGSYSYQDGDMYDDYVPTCEEAVEYAERIWGYDD